MQPDYWRAWHGRRGRGDWVRYPAALLEAAGLPTQDRDFLADAGLPAWAAPHFHFARPASAALPGPEDPYGAPYPGAPATYRMLGSADDWPVCLDRARPGVVVWLHPTEAPRGVLVNSSVRQLAASLLAYNQAVETALRHGCEGRECDAWRRRTYPAAVDQELRAAITALDPATGSAEGFWARHFSARARGT